MSETQIQNVFGSGALALAVALAVGGCASTGPATVAPSLGGGGPSLLQGLGATGVLPLPNMLASYTVEETSGSLQASDCPSGMVLIEGDYCPELIQTCLRWHNDAPPFDMYRCAEYAKTSKCKGKTVQKKFCIDQFEHVEPGSDLPLQTQAWVDAKRVCESEGKRVCWESEWNMACEGKERRPYAYGWNRDASACNVDNFDLFPPGNRGKLLDLRSPASKHPQCVTSEGVHGMAGNVAEWVSVDGSVNGSVVYQKGNWWQPGKHACRDAQAGHDKHYKGMETGFRCCKDTE